MQFNLTTGKLQYALRDADLLGFPLRENNERALRELYEKVRINQIRILIARILIFKIYKTPDTLTSWCQAL